MVDRAWARARAALALCFAFPLAACLEDDLSACVASTEQTVLLRRLTLPAKAKESLNSCLANPSFTDAFCDGLYVNANGIVRDCMARRGYTFTDADSGYGTCVFQSYKEPRCYGWTIALKMRPKKLPQ